MLWNKIKKKTVHRIYYPVVVTDGGGIIIFAIVVVVATALQLSYSSLFQYASLQTKNIKWNTQT